MAFGKGPKVRVPNRRLDPNLTRLARLSWRTLPGGEILGAHPRGPRKEDHSARLRGRVSSDQGPPGSGRPPNWAQGATGGLLHFTGGRGGQSFSHGRGWERKFLTGGTPGFFLAGKISLGGGPHLKLGGDGEKPGLGERTVGKRQRRGLPISGRGCSKRMGPPLAPWIGRSVWRPPLGLGEDARKRFLGAPPPGGGFGGTNPVLGGAPKHNHRGGTA